ncbi:TFIIIC subunit 6 family protein [Aspergillus vadensis CBS 113365]|uniref:Transcription factor TFIIIC triple barrel domain-containing protein n=1 Tax=Aspergillus vadensis (strain CBS 113365 / IMI 142717 / IBT 24658) TaxID=1448311 RepID=A0A319B7V2_ASPVC|nr:hypothetical protein BO88DRAFT_444028 [Aspergillus vadensis CBS 113365]PYH68797.1 hypothetical protein BO88DRAFT_444028 [Aspergillus vadensis CBS 113365]
MALPPPLMLDPAMLADSSLVHPEDDDDSEYEYEYHPTETETVYLTLDLTSLHGPIRPPRRRQPQDPSSLPTSSPSTPSQNQNQNHHDDQPDAALSSTEADPNNPSIADRVQILGLHTPNPIISYQNQIFSGTWADQIGTELLIARPEDSSSSPPHDADPSSFTSSSSSPVIPLRHTPNYDLLAANSVKILGRKANLISSSSSNVYAADSAAAAEQPSDSTTTQGGGVIRKNAPQTNQARFLDRLASLKRSKGETDAVRTTFSTKRMTNLEDRLRGWARTDEQLAQIQRLNELALSGDANAMAELEGLYSRLGGQDEEEEMDENDDELGQ